jgi:hypothetical protein
MSRRLTFTPTLAASRETGGDGRKAQGPTEAPQMRDRRKELKMKETLETYLGTVNTVPVDRSVAESAALCLAEIIGVNDVLSMDIQWVDSPRDVYYQPGDPSAFQVKASLWNALRSAFRDCNCDDSLKLSILESMWNEESLSDINWIMKYSYAVDVLGAKLPDVERDILRMYTALAVSCAEFQIIGKYIILSRKVEID